MQKLLKDHQTESGIMITLLRKFQKFSPDRMKFHQAHSDSPACFGKTENVKDGNFTKKKYRHMQDQIFISKANYIFLINIIE